MSAIQGYHSFQLLPMKLIGFINNVQDQYNGTESKTNLLT